MSTPVKFSIIIVSWNVAASLKECLNSLAKTHYPHLEIIVIDNVSTDDSLSVIKLFPTVRLIKNSQNIGFPRAVNQGLKVALGDYLVVLNPDTLVPSDFFLQSLNFFSGHPHAGIMGPKVVFPDGTPQGSVFPEPSVINTFREFWLGQTGLTAKFTPASSDPVPVNAISGACLVFPRSTFTAIGLLTGKVFMYYEDLDYCRRIRRFGLQVYFNPSLVLTHLHGQSSNQSPKSLTYLRDSSRWYNGWLKDTFMYLISLSGQKFGPIPHS